MSNYREPEQGDVGLLVEVTNDPSEDRNWQQARLAGIDMLDDTPFVCIPTHQRWINDCSDQEIVAWKHARIERKRHNVVELPEH